MPAFGACSPISISPMVTDASHGADNIVNIGRAMEKQEAP
jgi:hypothetical protein